MTTTTTTTSSSSSSSTTTTTTTTTATTTITTTGAGLYVLFYTRAFVKCERPPRGGGLLCSPNLARLSQ